MLDVWPWREEFVKPLFVRPFLSLCGAISRLHVVALRDLLRIGHGAVHVVSLPVLDSSLDDNAGFCTA